MLKVKIALWDKLIYLRFGKAAADVVIPRVPASASIEEWSLSRSCVMSRYMARLREAVLACGPSGAVEDHVADDSGEEYMEKYREDGQERDRRW